MAQLVYDDEYTGPRWTYALLLRPLLSAAPKGWIIWSNRTDPRFPHGTVDYPFELPADDVERFDLKLVSADER